MKILAFDTTLQACSVAYLETDKNNNIQQKCSDFKPIDRGHAECLTPMIGRVMSTVGVDYHSLDRIAVTRGPGSFTGVRIGVAAARGFSLSLGCDLVGLTSFEVMAHQALRKLDKNQNTSCLAVITDARRGQVYMQIFDTQGHSISDLQAVAPAKACQMLLKQKTVLVGSGAEYIFEALQATSPQLSQLCSYDQLDLLPHATDLAYLAQYVPTLGDTISPLYLRPPDAKPQNDKILGRDHSFIL